MSINTIVLTLVLFVLAAGKFLAPNDAIRDFFRQILAGIAEVWIAVNNVLLSFAGKTRWDVEIPQGLDRKGCYLVNSNHQSWVDILVLQRCFNRRLPFVAVFPEKPVDLGAVSRYCLVGSGFSIHETYVEGEAVTSPGSERPGSGECPQGLRKIQEYPGCDDEFSGRNTIFS